MRQQGIFGLSSPIFEGTMAAVIEAINVKR